MVRSKLKVKLPKNLIVLTILSITTISCENDLADCTDGQCCYPNAKNKLMKNVIGKQAALLGSSFLFKEVLEQSDHGPINLCLSCPVQSKNIAVLNSINNMNGTSEYGSNTNPYFLNSTPVYSYRVWGALYEITEISSLTSDPVYVFRLDKVEIVD